MMTSAKTVAWYSKYFLFCMKVFKLVSICAKFQVNRSSLLEKKLVGNFTSPTGEGFRGQNALVGIELTR